MRWIFWATPRLMRLPCWSSAAQPAWRANAALFKGLSLGVLALWVGGSTLWRAIEGGAPEPMTMSAVGALALCVNVGAALLLYRFRDGEANVRSVWLCSRNDAIGNVAVVFAAAAVWASGAAWPDLVVALAMSALFLQTAARIVRQARGELRQLRSAPPSVRRSRAALSYSGRGARGSCAGPRISGFDRVRDS